MVARVVFLLALVFSSQAAFGQTQQTDNTWVIDKNAKRPECKVEALSWLTGSWVGSGLGGECEELWGTPRAGAMLGAFRMFKDGKTVFSEHIVVVEEAGTIVLKLKHFDPELKGWEEKDKCVEFPLIVTKEREARFDGITYRLVSENEMHVFVAMAEKDQPVQEAKFVFRR